MIEYINIEDLNKAIATFDNKVAEMYKAAFTQGTPPPPPMTQQPPMDPAAAQGGAPMDPNAMPPMDPSMAQGAGAPPPGIGPELEKNLTALFGGVEQMSQVITQQQDQIQTMSTRLQQIEQMLDEQNKALQTPAGFEGQPA